MTDIFYDKCFYVLISYTIFALFFKIIQFIDYVIRSEKCYIFNIS